MDAAYIEDIKKLSLSPECIERHKDMKIVYTPIHGTGVVLVPGTLRAFGFTNIIDVPEQNVISGDFPTVVSPNPEEPAATASNRRQFYFGARRMKDHCRGPRLKQTENGSTN